MLIERRRGGNVKKGLGEAWDRRDKRGERGGEGGVVWRKRKERRRGMRVGRQGEGKCMGVRYEISM